jgi:hypothetical protein
MTKCFCDRCGAVIHDRTGYFISINDKASKDGAQTKRSADPRKTKFDICDKCRDELGEFLISKDFPIIDF